MKLFSFLLILGGLAFVRSAVRGTKPSSTVLWGKDSAGKPIEDRRTYLVGSLGRRGCHPRCLSIV